MTVLAASVITRSGKPLISRQFHGSFARARLESLLVSFTKLIPANVEHTTLLSSDGSIRYVYAPVDDLYVLLLTPPSSNIILDLDTLRLLTRIVSETCASMGAARSGGGANEAHVLANSFELLSSFDEVISMGYRDKVGIGEVRAAMEMESHEERIQEIIARNKEMEAKEELKRRAKQLEMQRKEMMRRGQDPYASLGSSGSSLNNRYDSYTPTPAAPSAPVYDYSSSSAPTASAAPKFKNKGMQLGASKANKNRDLVDALGGGAEEEPIAPVFQHAPAAVAAPEPVPSPVNLPASQTQANPFGQVDHEDVHCMIRETLSMELGREGGLAGTGPVTVSGSLDLHLGSADMSKVAIQLSHAGLADTQFKPHPNVDKAAWTKSSWIKMRDANKGFPVGQDVKVLRWKMVKNDDSLIPLSINCWPSQSDSGMAVTIEYEVDNDSLGTLKDVLISIPLPPGSYPSIETVAGSCDVNTETHTLDWSIEEIDPADEDARNGLLEFTIPGDDSAALFPIAVDFVALKSYVDVNVRAAQVPDSEESAPFSVDRLCQAEDYLVS